MSRRGLVKFQTAVSVSNVAESDREPVHLSRRAVLGGALAIGGLAGTSAVGVSPASAASSARAKTKEPGPGSLPNPSAPPGTEQLPQITNIVALMMENHSYDSILGMLQNVAPGRGNGFTIVDGVPTNSNPWPKNKNSAFPPPGKDAVLSAFPMPTPCQLSLASTGYSYPWNTWLAGHVSFAGGKMDGFVKSQSGPVSMGYYDQTTLPFVYSLASTFPLCDNFFSSVMAQTYPNRRFFMAGTALGEIADTQLDQLASDRPPNGTIFETLNKYGITWKNYYQDTPSYLIWTYLYLDKVPNIQENVLPISDFFTDAANGTLPQYSMVDPNFGSSLTENPLEKGNSEEDPQDIQYGDVFMSQVINAVMSSPQWPNTMLVWTYDEGGGYYDHVPPPKAVKPDHVPPVPVSGQPKSSPFGHYGFRVPSGVVSPYAKPDYVSSVVYDHTSILKLIETKWNLPALTYRDAQAADLLDTVDLTGSPAFLTPPTLASPPDPETLSGCLSTGPGTIPPAGYTHWLEALQRRGRRGRASVAKEIVKS
jgi:phospholipase C